MLQWRDLTEFKNPRIESMTSEDIVEATDKNEEIRDEEHQKFMNWHQEEEHSHQIPVINRGKKENESLVNEL